MKRLAEQYLEEWFSEEDRKPLIIRGARQVGKSTLVKIFAEEKKCKLIEINFEKNKLKTLSDEEINLKKLIIEIEDLFDIVLSGPKIILFLDEAQASPKILSYLRYFYEESPSIAVICTGSLLDFFLTEEEIGIPVGRVDYFYLGPFSFEEFLMAIGKNLLLKRMDNFLELTVAQHQQLTKLHQEFIQVGGMPAAIKVYINSQSIKKVRKIQESLLQTYRDDFIKYAKKNKINHLEKVFNYVPFNLGRKIKYSEISLDIKSIEIRNAIDLLIKSRVIIPVIHTNASGLPISSFSDEKILKLYFLDTGLALCALGFTNTELFEDVHGEIFEQVVAQQLYYRDEGKRKPELYYWLKDKTLGKAEVDFVIQLNREIVPVEVKAGKTGNLKSLWQMIKEKKINSAIHFSNKPPQKKIQKYANITAQETSELSACIYELPHYLAYLVAKEDSAIIRENKKIVTDH